MKKHILLITSLILPIQIFAFSVVGDPVKIPNEKEYVIYNSKIENVDLPPSSKASVDTTLLVYNIQAQTSKATQMFYIKNNQVNNFKDSVWAIPVSKMLTVATFEYLLDNNVVHSLAFEDINIRQDFTLSGTTSYGPIIDIDNNKFYFYISFYLKNEKTNKTEIKTFKYQQQITAADVTAESYATLTNKALAHIFKELKPWLIKTIKTQKAITNEVAKKQALVVASEKAKEERGS